MIFTYCVISVGNTDKEIPHSGKFPGTFNVSEYQITAKLFTVKKNKIAACIYPITFITSGAEMRYIEDWAKLPWHYNFVYGIRVAKTLGMEMYLAWQELRLDGI